MGWLEDEFPFGARPIFRRELLVSGKVIFNFTKKPNQSSSMLPHRYSQQLGKSRAHVLYDTFVQVPGGTQGSWPHWAGKEEEVSGILGEPIGWGKY